MRTARSADENYLKNIGTGNPKVMREVYTKYFPVILQFITANKGTREDARDIFQEAIVVVYEYANSEKPTIRSTFLSLLYTICRNLWLKQLRRRQYQQVEVSDTLLSEHQYDNIDQSLLTVERFGLYQEKFNLLGSACKKVLRLFFEKKSMHDILTIMGFSSIDYAKKRKYKCKEKLIQLIKNDRRYNELTND